MATLDIDISDRTAFVLERLQPLCGLSEADVVENAIALLAFASTEVAEGRPLAAIDFPGKLYKEVRMPALAAAARNGALRRRQAAGEGA